MTSMPATAVQVRTARKVPAVSSSHTAGRVLIRTAARWSPVPGMRERAAIETTAKRAYVAATGWSSP